MLEGVGQFLKLNGQRQTLNAASLIYIYFACLSVSYPINVKTAELIGSKFCVGPLRKEGIDAEESQYRATI